MATHAELVSDLKALRKGRGLFVNNVDERVGRALRDLCGVTRDDGPGEIRYRVAQRLAALAGDLPEDLQLAVMAAFGMNPDARHALYQERVDWLAGWLGRDPRTARRRIDDGIDQLAQLARTPLRLNREAPPVPGWYVAETRVVLVLDRATPEVIEYHRIIAEQDGLAEIDLSPVFRRHSMLYGGILRAGTLVLPTPLSAEQSHEFAVQSTSLVPLTRFTYAPRRRCELLDLRVRFDNDVLPAEVRRIQGQPVYDQEHVLIDPVGEIHITFHDVVRSDACGIRWDGEEVESR